MRVTIKKYEDGETFAVETSNDGAIEQKKLIGSRQVGKRIAAFAEVLCDENSQGVDQLIAALTELQKELGRRKTEYNKANRSRPRTAQPIAIGSHRLLKAKPRSSAKAQTK